MCNIELMLRNAPPTDICAACRELHQTRVTKAKEGKSRHNERLQIEKLTHLYCPDKECSLHPNKLWNQNPVTVTEVHACCCDEGITREITLKPDHG